MKITVTHTPWLTLGWLSVERVSFVLSIKIRKPHSKLFRNVLGRHLHSLEEFNHISRFC